MSRKGYAIYFVTIVVLGIGFVNYPFIQYVTHASSVVYTSTASYIEATSSTEFLTVPTQYSILNDKIPSISAKSFVIGDLDTGEIILSNDDKTARPIASISKLMTALVASEHMGATNTILVSQEAKVGQCISDLKVGGTFALSDIFYSLLLKSNNEAAEAIAITYGRSEFINLMNNKASELGLSSMNFNDPSGLSPENVSNANDLFSFAKYLYNNQSDIIAITKTEQYQIIGHHWINISKFINDKDYLGGKNGYTDEAKQTLVAMFREKIGKDYHNIAFILLDGAANKTDVSKLSSFVEKYVAVKTNEPKSLVFNP